MSACPQSQPAIQFSILRLYIGMTSQTLSFLPCFSLSVHKCCIVHIMNTLFFSLRPQIMERKWGKANRIFCLKQGRDYQTLENNDLCNTKKQKLKCCLSYRIHKDLLDLWPLFVFRLCLSYPLWRKKNFRLELWQLDVSIACKVSFGKRLLKAPFM